MSQSIKVISNESKLNGQAFKSIPALGKEMTNGESVGVHQVDTIAGATKDVGYRFVNKSATGEVTFTRPTKELAVLQGQIAANIVQAGAPIVKEALVQARKELG